MKALLATLSLLAVSGCASSALSTDSPPRSLVTSPAAPSCAFLCFIEVVITDTEEDIESTGGGGVSTTTTTTESVSGPSMAVGASQSEAKQETRPK